MKIGDVHIEGKAVLAPLAGITDSNFRVMCKRMGASLVFSEMVSADGIARGNLKTFSYLAFEEEERPIGIQLFGDSPDVIAKAAFEMNLLKPDIIDLNFGCPHNKVIKRGAGSAILKDLKTMERIARALVRETDLPVTAKIRSGWDSKNIIAKEAAQILEHSGVKAITIHPRTQSMGFSGKSDWSIIQAIKQTVKIPVIGNGDVDTPEKAKKMLDETGCDLVMIGRASFGNPWIFSNINHYLENAYELPGVSFNERIDLCIEHIKLHVKKKGEFCGVREMRKHIGWYTKGLPNSASFRREINQIDISTKVIEKLIEYKHSIEKVLVQ